MDRAQELGYRKLVVEFRKQPNKHKGACQYDVLVEGVYIGMICKDYEPGWYFAQGIVGGSQKGCWMWYFHQDTSLSNCMQRTLWFEGLGSSWDTQKELRAVFERAMDCPLEDVAFESRVPHIQKFLAWLQARAAAKYTLDGEPVDIEQFIADNTAPGVASLSEAEIDQIRALKPGESMTFGGGAAAEFVLFCEEPSI